MRVRTKDLQRPWKIIPPMKDVHQCFYVAQIEPIPTWADDDECISHLQLGARFVLKFPSSPVISGEASGPKWQKFKEEDEDFLVHYHPKGFSGLIGITLKGRPIWRTFR